MPAILVVDDEESLLDMLTAALEDEGYAVASAKNGAEAWASVPALHPDVILTDIMMPHMNGVQLCEHLTAHPEYKAVPIIIMSAGSNRPKLDGCRYSAFLEKPFDLDQLYAVVHQVLPADQT